VTAPPRLLVASLALAVLPALAACRGPTGPSGAPVLAVSGTRPSAGCGSGAAPALVGAARTLDVDGLTRHFLIDAPAGPADAALPLVLVFHGFRHSAAGLRDGLDFAARAASGALVAVHADGRDDVRLLDRVGRGWDIAPGDTRDTAFVRALLDTIERERCIDLRRIYATGFSNGGFLSNLLGCRLGDRLAAIAPVAGARPLDACTPPAPMPVLFFHGSADRVVPPRLTVGAAAWWRRANRCGDGDEARDGCRAANGCAADVVVCEGPQAHSWPEGASAAIWRFFEEHPRQ
jgi:polyhydroxybutyrate depolymerase